MVYGVSASARLVSVESPLAVRVDGMTEPNPTLNELRDLLRNFASERDWEKFHTPRNLLLALVGEVGELAGGYSSRPACARSSLFALRSSHALPLTRAPRFSRSAECFQWLGDDAAKPGLPGMDKDKKTHVGEELADVLLYVLRLADVCGIDMHEAVLDKIAKNAAKYPVELARGRASKYTELEN